MRRREFFKVIGGGAVAALPFPALAQQTERIQRIGVLMGFAESDAGTNIRIEGLRQGLGALGWSEGRNVSIDYRFAPGARAQALAKELVALQPDVIVSHTSPPTAALQRETRTIPIVFTAVADPIGSGFVASLAQPGANITGFLLFEASITGKWLAMLRDMVPALARAILVLNPKTAAAYYEFYLRAAQAAASSLGIELALGPIGNEPAEIERVFEAFARTSNGGLLLPPDINTYAHRDLLIALAARHRLPAVYSDRLFVEAGGLMCYTIDRADMFRAAARYVDRILRGAKPADLPVQVPTKYETVINLKTAKALGLTVPPGMLVAADEVIE